MMEIVTGHTLYKAMAKEPGKYHVIIIWELQEHLNGLKMEVLQELGEIIMIKKLNLQFLNKFT